MLSREELLRELELLPVWQLRNPVPPSAVQVDVVLNDVVESIDQVQEVIVDIARDGVQLTDALVASFRLMLSSDGQWAFILGPHDDAAEQLLQNMLKAISVSINQDIADAEAGYLNRFSPNVIVVLGETEAQQLLNKTQRIEQMRGSPHLLKGTPVIVTYSPSYLLSNLTDKAKAWEDLCLAKFTITALKSDQ